VKSREATELRSGMRFVKAFSAKVGTGFALAKVLQKIVEKRDPQQEDGH
jgi:hypothetical protein